MVPEDDEDDFDSSAVDPETLLMVVMVSLVC